MLYPAELRAHLSKKLITEALAQGKRFQSQSGEYLYLRTKELCAFLRDLCGEKERQKYKNKNPTVRGGAFEPSCDYLNNSAVTSVLKRPGSDLLSQALRLSTIGPKVFHVPVRDGMVCFTLGKTTRSFKNRSNNRFNFCQTIKLSLQHQQRAYRCA